MGCGNPDDDGVAGLMFINGAETGGAGVVPVVDGVAFY